MSPMVSDDFIVMKRHSKFSFTFSLDTIKSPTFAAPCAGGER